MEAYNENGDIVTDETYVPNQWKTDFKILYRNDGENTHIFIMRHCHPKLFLKTI